MQSGIYSIGGFRTPLCEHRAGFSGMRRDDAAAPNIERIIVVGGATGEIFIGHSYRVGPTATGNLFGASGTRLVPTLARGLCENNGKNSRITRRFGGDQSTYCLLER